MKNQTSQKIELGPIQKEWIKSLREHPERQTKNQLGFKEPDDNYKACCLGELGLICAKHNIGNVKFSNNHLFDYSKDSRSFSTGTLRFSFEDLGLSTPNGELLTFDKGIVTLSSMNDSNYTWSQIADFVEANPEKVFTKSY